MSRSKDSWMFWACAGALLSAVMVGGGCTTEDADADDESSGGADDGSGGTSSGTGGSGDTTGDAGSNGGEPSPTCDNPPIDDGSNPLITDFEDVAFVSDGFFGFAFTSEAGVYGGYYVYADASVTGIPDDVTNEEMQHVYESSTLVHHLPPEGRTGGGVTAEIVAGPSSDRAFSVTLVGSDEWGGGMGFWMSGCPDVSVYSGITFWARSNVPGGTVTMSLMTADTLTPADHESGQCAADSASPASVELDVSSGDWTEFTLPWSDFIGGLCGIEEVDPSGANLTGFEWSIDGTYGTAEDLEFAIDDVGFYQ